LIEWFLFLSLSYAINQLDAATLGELTKKAELLQYCRPGLDHYDIFVAVVVGLQQAQIAAEYIQLLNYRVGPGYACV